MLYAAKCYWPEVNDSELAQLAARAERAYPPDTSDGIAYRGSLLFADDDLVLCLIEGPSRAAVNHASDRIGIPCERLMCVTWLDARGQQPRTSSK